MIKQCKTKWKSLVIERSSTLLVAIKKMDEVRCKLLIIMENGNYSGLLSVGDIQRAIIQNISLDASVSDVMRSDIITCDIDDSEDDIRSEMLRCRAVFMPLLNKEGDLADIIFWEDLFSEKNHREVVSLNIPVVIMAGGKGVRLRPLTNVLPKPLLPISEKTILEMIMDRFVAAGCHQFYLSVNYKASMIRHYFDTLANSDFQIEYLQEDMPMGTAGSLHLLKGQIDSTFFVSNCDIVLDQDIAEIVEYHKENKNEITLVSVLKHMTVPYGTVETAEDGLLQSITEKPEFLFKVNSGVYILEPHLLDEIPDEGVYHLTDLVEKVRARQGRVGVFPVSEGTWTDIGTWAEYVKAIEHEQLRGGL